MLTGGRDPSSAPCGRKTIRVETFTNVANPTRSRQPLSYVRLVVCYTAVHCLHKNVDTPTLCEQGVPATCAVVKSYPARVYSSASDSPNEPLVYAPPFFNEAHNLSGIAVRIPELVWYQRLTLGLVDKQAGADTLGRRRRNTEACIFNQGVQNWLSTTQACWSLFYVGAVMSSEEW